MSGRGYQPHRGGRGRGNCHHYRPGDPSSCRNGANCFFVHSDQARPSFDGHRIAATGRAPTEWNKSNKPCRGGPDGVCRRKDCFYAHYGEGEGQVRHEPWNRDTFTVATAVDAKTSIKQHFAEKVLDAGLPEPVAPSAAAATPLRHPRARYARPYERQPGEVVMSIDVRADAAQDDAFSLVRDETGWKLTVFVATVAGFVAPGTACFKWAHVVTKPSYALALPSQVWKPFDSAVMNAAKLSGTEPRPAVAVAMHLNTATQRLDSIDAFECLVSIDKFITFDEADTALRSTGGARDPMSQTLIDTMAFVNVLYPHANCTKWKPAWRVNTKLLGNMEVSLSFSDAAAPSEFIVRAMKHMADDQAVAFCEQRNPAIAARLLARNLIVEEDQFESSAEMLGPHAPRRHTYADHDAAWRRFTSGYYGLLDALRASDSAEGQWQHLEQIKRTPNSSLRAPFTRPLRDFISFHNQCCLLAAIGAQGVTLPPEIDDVDSFNRRREALETMDRVVRDALLASKTPMPYREPHDILPPRAVPGYVTHGVMLPTRRVLVSEGLGEVQVSGLERPDAPYRPGDIVSVIVPFTGKTSVRLIDPFVHLPLALQPVERC